MDMESEDRWDLERRPERRRKLPEHAMVDVDEVWSAGKAEALRLRQLRWTADPEHLTMGALLDAECRRCLVMPTWSPPIK